MSLEEKYTEMMERFRKDAFSAVDEAINTIHCDIAPHLDTDTDSNVTFQAGDIIREILGGNFLRVDFFTVIVTGHSGISVTVTMTNMDHDRIRKNLLEVMPACPKDLEIQSLKDQLSRAYDRDY